MDGLSESMLYAAEILGTPDLAEGLGACELPLETRVQRLADELDALGRSDDLTVRIADLYDLAGADRLAALDAVGVGEPSPFVIVRGRLACAGTIDTQAVLEAIRLAREEEESECSASA